jgi:hypothetical protein
MEANPGEAIKNTTLTKSGTDEIVAMLGEIVPQFRYEVPTASRYLVAA